LAADFPALPVQCRPLDDLDHCLSTCSLVFTSTAADDPVISAERLRHLNRRSSLMLIDIGVPRNI
jgi:glutamyl-tRNA reductase